MCQQIHWRLSPIIPSQHSLYFVVSTGNLVQDRKEEFTFTKVIMSFPVAQMVNYPPAMWETWVWSLEDPLEKGMTAHSSILAWRIPWTEEPGGLQSMGSQGVGHEWSNLAHTHAMITPMALLLWGVNEITYIQLLALGRHTDLVSPGPLPINITQAESEPNNICVPNTHRQLLLVRLCMRKQGRRQRLDSWTESLGGARHKPGHSDQVQGPPAPRWDTEITEASPHSRHLARSSCQHPFPLLLPEERETKKVWRNTRKCQQW